jgi:hypothetical protein
MLIIMNLVTFDAEDISPCEWPREPLDSMSHLVLPPERDDISVLKALSHHRDSKRTAKGWAADFIQGKGEGQVFLLHGTS